MYFKVKNFYMSIIRDLAKSILKQKKSITHISQEEKKLP